MKVLGKITKIIFIIALVLSITLNILIAFSTTNKLIFKDDLDARIKIANNSLNESYEAMEKNGFYITSTNKKKDSEETVKETIYCDYDKTKQDLSNCKMLGYAYDKDNKLIRTTYFPANGYKYVDDGETKVKSPYANESINAYASGIAGTWLGYLSGIITHPNNQGSTATRLIQYDTTGKFSFNTFSFIKTISCTLKVQDKEYLYKLDVDSKDRIISVFTNINGEASLNFSYKKKTIAFPSFENFASESN